MNQFYVLCRECSEQHLVHTVKFLNVEEDIQGRDVMYFECPETKESTKSLVYSQGDYNA